MPLPPAAHGTTNRWRAGCRDCADCRTAHNRDTRDYRRRLADQAFPARARTRLLRLLSDGASIVEAAEQVGVTQQTVHSRRRVDPAWGEQLDAALMAGRNPEAPHGTPAGYRHWRCRCPECRAVHHPASLGFGHVQP